MVTRVTWKFVRNTVNILWGAPCKTASGDRCKHVLLFRRAALFRMHYCFEPPVFLEASSERPQVMRGGWGRRPRPRPRRKHRREVDQRRWQRRDGPKHASPIDDDEESDDGSFEAPFPHLVARCQPFASDRPGHLLSLLSGEKNEAVAAVSTGCFGQIETFWPGSLIYTYWHIFTFFIVKV